MTRRTTTIPTALLCTPMLGHTCRHGNLHWVPYRYQAAYGAARDEARRALWRLTRAQLRRFLKMHEIDAPERATKYDLWLRAFLARIDSLFPERELTDAEASDPRNLPYPAEERSP